jgi:hypothetical protein
MKSPIDLTQSDNEDTVNSVIDLTQSDDNQEDDNVEYANCYIKPILKKNLKLLFIGINPTISPRKNMVGRFFSGRKNSFWPCINASSMLLIFFCSTPLI